MTNPAEPGLMAPTFYLGHHPPCRSAIRGLPTKEERPSHPSIRPAGIGG
uniref:Uncharacterized protein n=1 Tax=Pseudomonas phage Baskent_P1_112 TaxID=3145032 RepID=A0AAU8BB51_9CAUD